MVNSLGNAHSSSKWQAALGTAGVILWLSAAFPNFLVEAMAQAANSVSWQLLQVLWSA